MGTAFEILSVEMIPKPGVLPGWKMGNPPETKKNVIEKL